jgi:hypothetical protein
MDFSRLRSRFTVSVPVNSTHILQYALPHTVGGFGCNVIRNVLNAMYFFAPCSSVHESSTCKSSMRIAKEGSQYLKKIATVLFFVITSSQECLFERQIKG